MIEFNGVHKWFKKLHVLNDINLHVKPGEVVVVCGPSGSGKTTLIRTINQLEPIDQGPLIVDGMNLSDKATNINKLRAEIGFVFQQFNRTMAYPTEIFLFIAAVYFLTCYAFTSLSRALERKLSVRATA